MFSLSTTPENEFWRGAFQTGELSEAEKGFVDEIEIRSQSRELTELFWSWLFQLWEVESNFVWSEEGPEVFQGSKEENGEEGSEEN